MYTHPNTAEECLHNALKIINALRFLRIDYDIQVQIFFSYIYFFYNLYVHTELC